MNSILSLSPRPRARLLAAASEVIWLTSDETTPLEATVHALALARGLTVRRVDLGELQSKYIGETEKNLARLLDQAEQQRWLLFFDEADALFGRRTEINDAHDRYATVELTALLPRIVRSNVTVVLARQCLGRRRKLQAEARAPKLRGNRVAGAS